MKSKFMVIVLLAMLVAGVHSASAQVRKWELEVGAGAITPTSKLEFDKNTVGWNAMAEVRRNFGALPLDLGLRVDGNVFNRKYEELEDLLHTQFSSLNVMAVADLNVLRAKQILFFVGAGLGYGWLAAENQIINPEIPEGLKDKYEAFKTVKETSVLTVMPRVGIELFHHLRATLYYKVHAGSKDEQLKDLVKGQGHFGLSLGVVLGGGLKNKAKDKE
jgi:opacity protein-like surface antigen